VAVVSTTLELQVGSPEAAHAYRTMLGDLRGVAVSDRPLLEGCVADAAIAPTNSFGYLDAGIDGAFARRFGRRLQRALQERIGLEFEGEMPVGEALVLPTGDLALPFVVAAPASQFPSAIATEPLLYRSLVAAFRTIDAWNVIEEGPPIERIILPDVAQPGAGWELDRLAPQVRRAIEVWQASRLGLSRRAA
jgi:O-acetyl-ADP-ribose deacetylase (regulator of RNase III)